MPTFVYSGKAMSGEVRKGEINAPNMAQATAALRRQQIVASSITPKKSLLARLNEIQVPGMGKGIKTKELVIFTRQFATMIDAGLPLVQCLDILATQHENPAFQKVLFDVKGSVEGGSTFADALQKHPKVFDSLFVNLVAAGEVGGILDTILNRLSAFMEKNEKIKGKVKGAMSYPVAVIAIALVIVSGLLIFIVPVFEEMFKDFGQSLPAPTQFIVTLSNIIKFSWYYVIAFGFAFFMGIKQMRKTHKGRFFIDKLLLKVPAFGDLLKKTAVARFSRTLGTMMASGVPILESLELVAKTAGNAVIEDAIMKARASLSEGKTLAEPLEETGVFPGMVTQMIAVGEQTGAMDTMLSKIADFYEDEVDVAVDTMTSLIEPMLMVFLGVVVGGLVISLYLPIFSIAGAASGS
ncbi:MAG: type II secretion system F family protein [Thermodesulfobacteriota bacterium]